MKSFVIRVPLTSNNTNTDILELSLSCEYSQTNLSMVRNTHDAVSDDIINSETLRSTDKMSIVLSRLGLRILKELLFEEHARMRIFSDERIRYQSSSDSGEMSPRLGAARNKRCAEILS